VSEILRRWTSPELTELMALENLRINPPKKKQSVAEAKSVLAAMARRKR
jgi:hypothetical protein